MIVQNEKGGFDASQRRKINCITSLILTPCTGVMVNKTVSGHQWEKRMNATKDLIKKM